MLISVVVCTRDRAEDLRQTLHSLAAVKVPDGCTCELLLVDNASADHTQAVFAATQMLNMTVRPFHEPLLGKSAALNLGLSHARGEIIVFTDDDLRYSPEWLKVMTKPLRSREAEAVTGVMRLAPHLERDWMRPVHRMLLAAPPLDSYAAADLIGANMAILRQVLSRVPWFDTELGPGALGFGDDTLFGMQVREAGYRIATVPLDTEHHFLPERLTRANFLSHAEKLGKSAAYTSYHWEHKSQKMARVNFYRKIVQLAAWRRSHPSETRKLEGMHLSEIHHLRSLHLYGQALIERCRPRNYERHGLVKLIGNNDV